MAIFIDSGARRPIITYIIISVVLFAALLGGIWITKNRSTFYAQQQSQPQVAVNDTQQENPSSAPEQSGAPEAPSATSPEPQPSVTQPAPAATNQPLVAPSPHASPAQVPSTGAEQLILPFASLSAFVFAALSYRRARRRLQSLV